MRKLSESKLRSWLLKKISIFSLHVSEDYQLREQYKKNNTIEQLLMKQKLACMPLSRVGFLSMELVAHHPHTCKEHYHNPYNYSRNHYNAENIFLKINETLRRNFNFKFIFLLISIQMCKISQIHCIYY